MTIATTLAQALHTNSVAVGMSKWSEADQRFARAVQHAVRAPARGLMTQVPPEVEGREKFYDDPTNYKTYLEQLGVAYPPQ